MDIREKAFQKKDDYEDYVKHDTNVKIVNFKMTSDREEKRGILSRPHIEWEEGRRMIMR